MLPTMRVRLVVMVSCVALVGGNKEHYNKEEHILLCEVLGAAVKRWGKNGENVTDQKVREALMQTIYGENEQKENPSKLNFPEEYGSSVDENSHNHRFEWCGTCAGKHYPGESATHDLPCLCTLGPDGIPNKTDDTLCGKKANELRAQQQERMRFGPNSQALKNTWEIIVKSCPKTGGEKS
ncbi:unnamed protein product [Trypanosoma congolense IL3000]|uniref:WGS project CAEQ00000000 data, annotated contig 1943 n=1 Tax=Trypanosoma congolense (strain IL3000) TaxID=1068625 RepID=F9WA72_TRYCI|nr:unnamed protein product [Trypanosoma congolense IL3000]